jgi:lipopolysaccharide export system protein LptA
VDIKQGTERITSEVSDVFLTKDQTNEVERTVAERNVVVTQPGKRGTGDRGEYVAADETVTLTGAPARVEDTEQGMTEGRRIVVYLRENRSVSDTAATPGGKPTGRIRTVHKVKKQ